MRPPRASTGTMPDLLREELGDVLMQVVFHADIERQRGGSPWRTWWTAW